MGGIETQVRQLAHHQTQTDDVAVFTTTPPRAGAFGRSVEHDGDVAVFRLAARMPLSLPIHPLAPTHLRSLLNRLRPDVVHLHMGGLAPSTQLSLLALHDWPSVLTIHSMWTAPTALGYRALTVLTGFRAWAPIVTAVAETPAERIREATGLPVNVIGCGVDVARWRVEPQQHGDIRFVCATRFTHRKRTLELLAMLKSAHDRAPNLRATIAGHGPLLAQARQQAKSWDWLDLPGRLDAAELKDLYARSDAFVLPSILEAGSVAVLEAQSAGLAVIVRAETGVADRITHGVNGYVVASDDGMADTIAALARFPGELATMKRHARENPPPFDWSDIAQHAKDAYSQALSH